MTVTQTVRHTGDLSSETAGRGDFDSATVPFRAEILSHCYRMMGSLHDAEDLVQDTYLRAWRAWDRFEGRSSVRTWLHRIATNTCLSALEGRSRRPLPTGLGQPASDPAGALVERPEVPWLEPVPDALVTPPEGDPAVAAIARATVRLAFVAALQHLPARQRAVLLLREVMEIPAAEVADMLGITVAAVNSALQRARAQLAGVRPDVDTVAEPERPGDKERLEKYVDALERKDATAIARLFTDDAVWEMPPFDGWYSGPDAIATLVDTQCPAGPGELRLVPTAANGQPAFGVYYLDTATGDWNPFQLHVLAMGDRAAGRGIAHVASFFDTTLFERFGLPAKL